MKVSTGCLLAVQAVFAAGAIAAPRANHRSSPLSSRGNLVEVSSVTKPLDASYPRPQAPVQQQPAAAEIDTALSTARDNTQLWSQNWAGAFTAPPSNTVFDSIYARWTVPPVSLPGGASGSGSWTNFAWVVRSYLCCWPRKNLKLLLEEVAYIDSGYSRRRLNPTGRHVVRL